MMMDMGSLAAWRGGTVKIYGVTLPLGTHGSVGCRGVPWGPPPVAAPPLSAAPVLCATWGLRCVGTAVRMVLGAVT